MRSALALAALLLLPATVVADEFSEYRVPDHSWRAGWGGLSLSASRANGNDQADEAEFRNGSANGGLTGTLRRGYDSDLRRHGWMVSAAANSGISYSQLTSLAGPSWHEQDNRTQTFDQQLSVSPWLRLNPGGSPLGFGFDGYLTGQWQQGWWRNDAAAGQVSPSPYRTLTRNSEQLHRYDYGAQLAASAGHGIVRDATLVEDVHVLEQRLREAGTLSRPLSREGRGKLARLLAATPEISNAHDRPERYRWREIERVLAEDGALASGGLDAYAVERVRENVMGRVSRQRGHFLGVVATVNHGHYIQRAETQQGWRYEPEGGGPLETQTSASYRSTASYDQVRAGVRAEWHRPAGWDWQWDAWAEVTAAVRPGEDGWRSDLRLDGSWHVADRWLVRASGRHFRDYLERDDARHVRPADRWNASQELSLDYFVEDHLSAGVRLANRESRVRQEYWTGVVAADYQHQVQFSAGLSWSFLGRAEAPGLYEPMSLGR